MKRTKKRRFAIVIKPLAVALLLSFLNLDRSVAADRPFRIGVVVPGHEFLPNIDGLKQGMKELGYIDGRDVHTLWRTARVTKRS